MDEEFDPSRSIPTEEYQTEDFDPNRAVPTHDYLVSNAKSLLAEDAEGKITLDDNHRKALFETANAESTPLSTLGNAAMGIVDAVSHPGKTLGAIGGLAKSGLTTAGKALGSVILSSLNSEDEDEINLAPNVSAGAYKGVSNLVPMLADARAGVLNVFDPSERTTRQTEAQTLHNQISRSQNAVTESVGADPESDAFKTSEFAAGMIGPPLGVESALAKPIAKLAEATVEGGTRLAGKAMDKSARVAKAVAPAAVATAEAASGHPYLALGTLVAGYGGEGVPIIGRLKHAIIDKGFDKIADVGKVIADTPDGMTIARGLQDSIDQQVSRLKLIEADKRAKFAGKISDVDKVGPNGEVLYDSSRLKGPDKEIREIQEEVEALSRRREQIGKYADLNRILSDSAKFGLRAGLNTGVAASTIGAISGVQALPGDEREATERGFELGAAIGAPGSYHMSARGKLAMNRESLVTKGREALPESHPLRTQHDEALASLPKEAQDYIHSYSGLMDGSGQNIVALKPSDFTTLLQQKGVLGENISRAPNGYYSDRDGTAYINTEGIMSGAVPHEVTHSIDQAMKSSMEGYRAKMKDLLESGNPEIKQQIESAVGNYEKQMQKSQIGFKLQPAQLREEITAALGADLFQKYTPEQLYGGKSGGQIIKDWASNLFGGKENSVTQQFGFPASPEMTSSLKDTLFDVGEKSKIGFPERTETVPNAPIAATDPVDASIVADATSALKSLNITDAASKVGAAISEISGTGATPTLEEVVKRAAQRSVPKSISPATAPESPVSPIIPQEPAEAPSGLRGAVAPQQRLEGAALPELNDPAPKFMPSDHPEALSSPAVQMEDGRVFTGWNHGSAWEDALSFGYDTEDISLSDRGFVTKTGSFLLTDEAAKHAERIGQAKSTSGDLDTTEFNRFMPDTTNPIQGPAIEADGMIFRGPTFFAARKAAQDYGISAKSLKSAREVYTTKRGETLDPTEARARGEETGQLPESLKDALSPEDLAQERRFMPSEEEQEALDYAKAERYFDIGQNDDEARQENDNWIYDPSSGAVKSKQGGTHGANWTHEVADRSFKGWHDRETGKISVVFPERERRKIGDREPSVEDIPTNVYNKLRSKFGSDDMVAFMPAVENTEHSFQRLFDAEVPESRLARIPSPIRDESIRNTVKPDDQIIDVSEDLPQGVKLTQDGGLWIARDDKGKLLAATGSRRGTLDQAREGLSGRVENGPKFMPGDYDQDTAWYHGTTAEKDFNTFKEGNGELGQGIYVTTRPDIAGAWAGRSGQEGGRIYPLRVKKGELFDLDELNSSGYDGAEKRDSTLLKIATRIKLKLELGEPAGVPKSWADEPIDVLARHIERGFSSNQDIRNKWLKAAGYIGAIKNDSQIKGQAVIFDKTYVKSAIGNKGSFNPNKGDIRFMPSEAVTKEAEALGLEYKGDMGDKRKIHLFNDPITKSTISIKEDAEPGTLQQKLRDTRQKFLNPDNLSFMPSENKDAIKEAAIRLPDGKIYTGFFHPDAMTKITDEYSGAQIGEWFDNDSFESGFVDGNGKYYTREEALAHAKKIKQVAESGYKKAAEHYSAGEFEPQTDSLESLNFAKARRFMPSGHPDAIKEAAIRFKDGSVWGGALHADALDNFRESNDDHFYGNDKREIDAGAKLRENAKAAKIEKAGDQYIVKDDGGTWKFKSRKEAESAIASWQKSAEELSQINIIEGFVTNSGEFLSRDEAGRRASQLGQMPDTKEELEANSFWGNRTDSFMPQSEGLSAATVPESRGLASANAPEEDERKKRRAKNNRK